MQWVDTLHLYHCIHCLFFFLFHSSLLSLDRCSLFSSLLSSILWECSESLFFLSFFPLFLLSVHSQTDQWTRHTYCNGRQSDWRQLHSQRNLKNLLPLPLSLSINGNNNCRMQEESKRHRKGTNASWEVKRKVYDWMKERHKQYKCTLDHRCSSHLTRRVLLRHRCAHRIARLTTQHITR